MNEEEALKYFELAIQYFGALPDDERCAILRQVKTAHENVLDVIKSYAYDIKVNVERLIA